MSIPPCCSRAHLWESSCCRPGAERAAPPAERHTDTLEKFPRAGVLQHRTEQRPYPGQELAQELMVQQQLPAVDQLLVLLGLEETERKKSPPPLGTHSCRRTQAEPLPRAAPCPPCPQGLTAPQPHPGLASARIPPLAPQPLPAPRGHGGAARPSGAARSRRARRGAAGRGDAARGCAPTATDSDPPPWRAYGGVLLAAPYVAALHAPPTSAPTDRRVAVAASDWLRG